MHSIAVFASGNGTNAQRFFDYFKHHDTIRIELLLCNNPDAKVLMRAEKAGVKTFVFSANDLNNTSKIIDTLLAIQIDYIVLAGFMLLVPENIIRNFKGRIVNIHPALLPNYGGKGMYGDFVHKAVIESGDKVSGITIHHVNSAYDEGDIIFQTECPVLPNDTIQTLAERIHRLEHQYYPLVVDKLISKKLE